MIQKVDRRGFLKGLAAGGLLLALDPFAVAEAAAADPVVLATKARAPFDPAVWVAIAPNGQVNVMIARSEMGQGSRSTQALAIADELGADRARVHIVQALGNEALYGSQNTDGSRSIRDDLDKLRHVGATARTMLESAAARRWKVPVSEVKARVHEVVHTPSGRRLGYGELAAAAWKEPVPATVTLKSTKELRYLGHDHLRSLDLDAMLTGKAQYGIDVTRPGMKVAAIARPPVYGGKVAKVDDRAARKVPGVVAVVRMPDGQLPAGFKPLGGVAVVATNTWAAIQGRNALKITWHDGPHAGYDSAIYQNQLVAASRREGKKAFARGDVKTALVEAPRVVRADYYVPHLVHAPMETPVATAEWHGDRVEVWAASQNPQAIVDELATMFKLPKDHATVHVTLLGGGFGRKSFPDHALEAAWIARQVKAPVKVQWTREDDIQHGCYHSVSAQHLQAGLTADGRVHGWLHRTAMPPIPSVFDARQTHASAAETGMGLTDLPYEIPDFAVEAGEAPAHARIGWFRSVANIQHAFAVNSFMAELSEAAGKDHRDFLIGMLGGDRTFAAPNWNYGGKDDQHPVDTRRLRGVVEAVTREADWDRKLPAGRGLGLAVHRSFLTYVATIVEVQLRPDGGVDIPNVWTAVDCGFAANPDRIRSQMEGAAVMGTSLALYGAITFKHGRVQQSNFHDFQLARMNVAPRQVHVTILPSDAPPGGVGEPGVPVFAPALVNAIRAAGGPRLRTLPILAQLAKG